MVRCKFLKKDSPPPTKERSLGVSGNSLERSKKSYKGPMVVGPHVKIH